MNKLLQAPITKVIRREIARILKSKILLFSTIAAPLFSLFIIMWIFSAGVVRDLPVTVIDLDHSALSRKVTQMLETSPIANVSQSTDINTAHNLMKKGKTDAIVLIPKDMERDVFKGNSPEIALYVNNANVVKGGLVYSGLYKTLSTFSAGIKVNVNMNKGMPIKQAISHAMPIKVDSHLLFNPYSNYSYFLTLGLLPLMILVFSFLVSTYAVGQELKFGTTKELLETAGNSITVALTGKLLPYTFLFIMNAMVMNLILFKILGTPLQGSLAAVLFSEFLLIITYQLIAVLFLSITANMRLTLSLGSAYTLMAMTFAGVTFPMFAMPMIAKIFACIFPYTFWIKIFVSQTVRNQPLMTTVPDFLVLLLFIVIGMLSFPGMKKKFMDSKYWGRS